MPKTFQSSFDCIDAGEHDPRPGAKCEACGFINAVRPPRRAPGLRRPRRADGLDDLRGLLRFR